VSRGEPKVSRRTGLSRNLYAPRSKPKNGLLLFLVAFSSRLSCRCGGATGFLLGVHGLYRLLGMNVVFESGGLRLLIVFSLSPSLGTLSFLHGFLNLTTAMARKKITRDELSARAKANGYQRGIHQNKDSRD
jgi:hypothetical protein